MNRPITYRTTCLLLGVICLLTSVSLTSASPTSASPTSASPTSVSPASAPVASDSIRTPNLKEEQNFKVEPYLLDITTTTAVVAFHLHTPLPAELRLFKQEQLQAVFTSEPNTSHFITVTGLEPGLSYRYEVSCGTNDIHTPPADQSYRIRSAGRPGEFFSFTVFGDPRPGENLNQRHHQQIINQIMLHDPAFNLILGDMVDNGSIDSSWPEFFKTEAPLLRRSALYPVIGDNDYAADKGLYTRYFPGLDKGYYQFNRGDIYFFGLFAWDSLGAQPAAQFDSTSEQYHWFQAQMERPEVRDAPFRVVFLHDPVYISRGRAAEILQRTWLPMFQKYNIDVVFSSRHHYERSQNQGVTYITTGGAGAELIWTNKNPAYPSQVEARQYHFCRIDVSAGAMEIRSIAGDGTVLDTFTLTPKTSTKIDTGSAQRAAQRLWKEILINNTDQSLPVLPLYVFSSNCTYCRRLLNRQLPLLAKQYRLTLQVYYMDLSIRGTYDLFLNAGAQLGTQNAELPAVFIGRTVLGGEERIQRLLPTQIQQFLDNPQAYTNAALHPFKQVHDTRTLGENRFNTLTFGLVLGAGLLDGINPCAFTTIIFLLSYLTLVGATRNQIIVTGTAFTLAVFITYLAIGLLFFNVTRFFMKQGGTAVLINILLLIMVITLAVLSFIDYLKCLKGRSSDMTLQLPGFLKKGIHAKIRAFARNKAAVTGAAFVLGVIIAGMELTCTGQVYFPIVTMISEPQHRAAAFLYLMVYNIAFILPLALVFLFVAFGLTSEKPAELFKRHTAGVKLGFTLLFLVMSLMILYNLGQL